MICVYIIECLLDRVGHCVVVDVVVVVVAATICMIEESSVKSLYGAVKSLYGAVKCLYEPLSN